MKSGSGLTRLQVVSALLPASLIAMFVAYRIGGVNWAVTVGTVLGVSTWLWSARKTFREQAASARAELTVDRQGPSADQDLERLSYRRIRVKNTGNRLLAQVEVRLMECPQHQAQFYPVRLQRMHGGAHPFDLAPGQEVYVELVALPLGHSEFIIVHDSSSHAGFPNGIPLQPLQLFVRITARDMKPSAHRFDVSKTAVGELTVVQGAGELTSSHAASHLRATTSDAVLV